MKTLQNLKISDKIKEALDKGFTVTGVAKILMISRPTLYAKMKDNTWSNTDIALLKASGIIS